MALVELVGGAVPDERKVAFEHHLAECASCREAVAILLRGRGASSVSGTPTHAEHVSQPLLQMPGARIGRYEVIECIGAGGMGIVYAARDPKLDRKVALKIVRSTTASSEVRLLREAQAMARLAHPNVVTVHDAVVHEGELVIAMELVPGMTLAQWLAVRERDWTEVVDVFVEAGRGLAAAHKAGLIHRDFKPSNVFVRDDGRVQVGDFGLARLSDSVDGELADEEHAGRSPLEADVTHKGTLVGTPRYMAPEQRIGHADERSDQYSFARALHESLLHTSENQITAPAGSDVEEPVALPSINKVIPPAIKRIIHRGTERVPSARFGSIVELCAALEAERGSSTRAIAPARGRLGYVLAGVAVVVAAGATVLALRLRSTDAPPAPRDVAVALLPFANHTREAELDFANVGLPRLLGSDLKTAEVRVIGTFELRDHAPRPPADEDVVAWRARAAEMGAHYTVSGVLESDGNGVVAAFALSRIDGIPVRVWAVQGKPTAIVGLVGERAAQLVAATGRVPAAPAGPRDFAAERDLTRGIEAFQQLRLADARSLFEAVLRRQPARGEALYYLAFTSWWANEPQQEVEAAAKRALAVDLLPEQRGVLVGLMALVSYDFARAIEHFRRLDEQYSGSSQVRYALSEALFHGGYPAEGMVVFRQLVDRAPHYHVGLLHPLSYYTVHRDEAGMQWGIAKAEQIDEASKKSWAFRLQLMRGDHRGAFTALVAARDEAGDRKVPFAFESELAVAAMVLDEDAPIALTKNVWLTLAFAWGRGDRAGALAALERVFSAATTSNDRRLRYNVAHVLPVVAATNDRELAEKSLVVLERAVGLGNASVDEQLGRLFLYAILGRADEIGRASSKVPEVAMVAKALAANFAGKPATDLWERAFDLSADGLFVNPGRFHLARALVAARDHAGVIAQCEALLRTHFVEYSFGAAIPQCLVWSAAAHEALGQRDRAIAANRRLIALRKEGDPLRAIATASLARLEAR